MSQATTSNAFESKGPNNNYEGEFKIEFDPKIKEAFQGGLQGGVDALGQLFTGLMKSITNAVGPELIRHFSASLWLEEVAKSLDEIVAAWEAGQAAPHGKSGELSCFLDRLPDEIAGSRVETQLARLRDQLSQAIVIVESDDRNIRLVSNVAGYFRASAKSSMPNEISVPNANAQ